MATDRLSAQVIADDSLSTWRFEKPAGTLAFAAASARLAAPNLVAVRADSASDAVIALGTGGETGTTLDYSLKLDGATDKLSIITAGGTTALTVDSAGTVTIPGLASPGYSVLTGTITHDPASIADGAIFTFTITVTGASTTNNPTVVVTPSIDLVGTHGIQLEQARVTAANTVTVSYLNLILNAAVNLPNHTVRATVFQY